MKTTLLTIACILGLNYASASTITVTNTNDSGAGSFREAVGAVAPNDTIRFDPVLISAGNANISLTSSVNVNTNMVIKGLYNTTDTLIISGGTTTGILNIGSSCSALVVDSLILIDGYGGSGGAISAFYIPALDLEVYNSVFDNNKASSGGGAIYMEINGPGTLAIENSAFTNNYANTDGGAVHLWGQASDTLSFNIEGCSFKNNGSQYYAGALYLREKTKGLVNNCSFNVNNAGYDGGAIRSSTDQFELSNSTLIQNIANFSGGAINSASNAFKMTGCILAENTSSNGNNIFGVGIISSGYNLFDDAPTGHDPVLDQINVLPANINLGPWQINGGTTPTMMPMPGSFAIDMGNPADMSDAQNGPVVGTRNVGAAEHCLVQYSSKTVSACGTYTSPSGNATITTAGSYTIIDTLSTLCGADSVVTISLTLNGTSGDNITANTCDSYLSPAGNTYTVAGTYTDTLMNAAGCDSLITITLSVNSVNNTVTQNGPTLMADQASVSYQWIDCDNGNAAISGATGQTYVATANGNYAVIVDNGLCSDTSACMSVVSVGIDDKAALGLSIYPNPNNGQFKLQIANYHGGIYTMSILDVTGKMVQQESGANSTLDINMEGVEGGIYFVRIVAQDRQQTIRFVVR